MISTRSQQNQQPGGTKVPPGCFHLPMLRPSDPRCNTGVTKSALAQQILENFSLKLVSEMMRGCKFLPFQRFKSRTKDVKKTLFPLKTQENSRKPRFRRNTALVDGTGLEPVTPCTSTNRVKRAEKRFCQQWRPEGSGRLPAYPSCLRGNILRWS